MPALLAARQFATLHALVDRWIRLEFEMRDSNTAMAQAYGEYVDTISQKVGA